MKDAAVPASPLGPDARAMRLAVYSSLEELPAGYARALDPMASPDFQLTMPWIQNFVHTALDPADRIRLYGVQTDDGSADALALLPMRSPGVRRTLAEPRVLSSLTNYYTCLFGPLLADGADLNRCVRACASGIAAEQPSWDMVRITPLAHDGEVFSELRAALRAAGFATQEFFSFGNWYLPVEGRTFSEYMESRPSVLQNTFRRKSKKLEQTGRARIEITTSLEGIDRTIADYVNVYNTSWKVPEPYPNFMSGLIRTCAGMGWLRLGLVYINDLPVAVQLWIVQNGVASIYKLAYDEKFVQFSVGTILTARLMQHALDVDHVREVDYLSGDDDYKKAWMSDRRERWGLLAFNPRTIHGVLAMARHIGGRKLKQAYKRTFRRSDATPAPAVHSEAAKA